MKEVILTCGPRGAGKSTYCNKYIETYPEWTLVSRDNILIKLFGKTSLDSYSGGHYIALDEMWEVLKSKLKKPNAKIILDCWNGFPRERRHINRELRELDAKKIEAWQFVTPIETVIERMIEREHADEKNKWRLASIKENYTHDYRLYHSFRIDLEQGFDFVRQIDPTQLTLFGIIH